MKKEIPPARYRVDTEWLKSGQKVEYQPRRVFGIQGVDHQERINFERLRRERLSRLKQCMQEQGFSALFLSYGDNIRYATGTWDQTWRGANQTRYAIVPLRGDPILFETAGCDLEVVRMNCPWMEGRVRPAITYLFTGAAFQHQLRRYVNQVKDSLLELGINPSQDKMGVDGMDFVSHQAFKEAKVNFVSGAPAIVAARMIKTKDELELLKISCSICDSCFHLLRHEWVKPGLRERDIVGKIIEYMHSHNIEFAPGATVASGANTNPYHRAWTDRVIRPGDMLVIDLAINNYLGYGADFVRCWPVGASFTPEQKEMYKECYNSLYSAINAIKPGATTADVAAGLAEGVDDWEGTCSLLQFGHSVGISMYEGYWISRAFSFEYPMPIEQNMFFAIETYAGKPGADFGCRLEENLVVTETGYQCFSLSPFEEEVLEGRPVGTLID